MNQKKVIFKKNFKQNKKTLGFQIFTAALMLSSTAMGSAAKNFHEKLNSKKTNESIDNFYLKNQKVSLLKIFKNQKIALKVLESLKSLDLNLNFDLGVNTKVSLSDVEKIQTLDLSNQDLKSVASLFSKPLIWKNLISLNLSKNNLANQELKFSATNFPVLKNLKIVESKLINFPQISELNKTLKNLDLSNNFLTSFNDQLQDIYFQNLDLSNNQLGKSENSVLKNALTNAVYFDQLRQQKNLSFKLDNQNGFKPFINLANNNLLLKPTITTKSSTTDFKFFDSLKSNQSIVDKKLFLNFSDFKKVLQSNKNVADLTTADLLDVQTDAKQVSLIINNKEFSKTNIEVLPTKFPKEFEVKLNFDNFILTLYVFNDSNKTLSNLDFDNLQVNLHDFNSNWIVENLNKLIPDLTSGNFAFLSNAQFNVKKDFVNNQAVVEFNSYNNQKVIWNFKNFTKADLTYKINKNFKALEWNNENFYELKAQSSLTQLAENFGLAALSNSLFSNEFELNNKKLSSKNIEVIGIDETNGEIQLTLKQTNSIYDNSLVILTGFKKSSISVVGEIIEANQNVSNLAFNRNNLSANVKLIFDSLIKKRASQITLSDVLALNVITTNRSDLKINSNNADQFLSLEANDLLGELILSLKTKGNLKNNLSPLDLKLKWTGFKKEATNLNQKTSSRKKRSLHVESAAALDSNTADFNERAVVFSKTAEGTRSLAIKVNLDNWRDYIKITAPAGVEINVTGVEVGKNASELILKYIPSQGTVFYSEKKVSIPMMDITEYVKTFKLYPKVNDSGKSILPSQINAQNILAYFNFPGLFSTPLVNGNWNGGSFLSDMSFENVNDAAGTVTLKYKVAHYIPNPTIQRFLSEELTTTLTGLATTASKTEAATNELTRLNDAAAPTLALNPDKPKTYVDALSDYRIRPTNVTNLTSHSFQSGLGSLTSTTKRAESLNGDFAYVSSYPQGSYWNDENLRRLEVYLRSLPLDMDYWLSQLIKVYNSSLDSSVAFRLGSNSTNAPEANNPKAIDVSLYSIDLSQNKAGINPKTFLKNPDATQSERRVKNESGFALAFLYHNTLLSATDQATELNLAPNTTDLDYKIIYLNARQKDYLKNLLQPTSVPENSEVIPIGFEPVAGEMNKAKIYYVLKSTAPNLTNVYSKIRVAEVSGFLTYEEDLQNAEASISLAPELAATTLPSRITAENLTQFLTVKKGLKNSYLDLPVPIFQTTVGDSGVKFGDWTPEDWKTLFGYLKSKPADYEKWIHSIAEKALFGSYEKRNTYNEGLDYYQMLDFGNRPNANALRNNLDILTIGGFPYVQDPNNQTYFDGIGENEVIKHNNYFYGTLSTSADNDGLPGVYNGIKRNLAQYGDQVSAYKTTQRPVPLDFKIVELNADDEAGTLTVKYKLYFAAKYNKSHQDIDGPEKTVVLTGFQTNAQRAQASTNNTNLGFSLKDGVSLTTKPSEITKTNFDEKIKTTVTGTLATAENGFVENASKTIVSVTPNDAAGTLLVRYTVSYESITSTEKVALIENLYTIQQEVDSKSVTFTNKPEASTVLPSELSASNYTNYLNVVGLPANYALNNVTFSDANDDEGTVTINYYLLTNDGYKSSVSKSAQLTGFSNITNKLNALVDNVSVIPSETGQTKLPTTLNSSTASDFSFNIPAGYELASISNISNPNDANGTVDISFSIQKIGNGLVTSKTKTISNLSGFWTFSKSLDAITANWTVNSEGAKTFVNNVNASNFQALTSKPTFSETQLLVSNLEAEIISVLVDGNGSDSVTVAYKVNYRNQTEEQKAKNIIKTATVSGFVSQAQLNAKILSEINNTNPNWSKKNAPLDIYGSSIIDSSSANQDINPALWFFPTTVEDLPVPTLEMMPGYSWKANEAATPANILVKFAGWTPDDWKYLFSYLATIKTTDPTTFNAWIDKIATQFTTALTAKRTSGESDVNYAHRLYEVRFDAGTSDVLNLWTIGGYGPSSGTHNGIDANTVMDYSWKLASEQGLKNGIIRNLGQYANALVSNENNPKRYASKLSATNLEKVKQNFNITDYDAQTTDLIVYKLTADDVTGTVNIDYSLVDKKTNQASYLKKATVNNFLTYQEDANRSDATFTLNSGSSVSNVLPSAYTQDLLNTDYVKAVIKNVKNSASVVVQSLVPNDVAGQLTVNYKIRITVDSTNYDSALKSQVLSGFKTTATSDQEALDATTTTFNKKDDVAVTTFGSIINSTNYTSYLTHSQLPANVTLKVTNVTSNDYTGEITISYQLLKEGLNPSSIKTATVANWYTFQQQVDNTSLVISNKPAAVNIAPTSVDWNTSSSANYFTNYLNFNNIPTGLVYEIKEVTNKNDAQGSFTLKYSLKKPAQGSNAELETTAASQKTVNIQNFLNGQKAVNNAVATITGKDTRSSYLASSVNEANKDTTLTITPPEGYNIVNLVFVSDDTNQSVVVKYQLRKTINDVEFTSYQKEATITGYQTIANALSNTNLTFSNKATAASTLLSSVNPTNYQNYINVNGLPTGFSIVDVSFTNVNDTEGTGTLNYKLQFKNEKSPVKTANISGFFNYRADIDAIDLQWSINELGRNTLASAVNANNYTSYMNISGLPSSKYKIFEPTFSVGSDGVSVDVVYKIKHFVTDQIFYTRPKPNVNVAGFLSVAQNNQRLVNQTDATFAKAANVGAEVKASSVTNDNFASKINTTLPEGFSTTDLSVATSDITGEVIITYKVTKDGVKSTDFKNAIVSNWATNKTVLDSKTPTFTNTDQAAQTLPSQVTGKTQTTAGTSAGNYTKYLTVSNLEPNQFLVDVIIENVNNDAGTFTLKYKISDGTTSSVQKTYNASQFQTATARDQANLVAALNSAQAVASQSFNRVYPSYLPANNLEAFTFTVTDGYELVPNFATISNANDQTGNVSVTIKVRKTGTTTDSSTRTIDNVTGFYNYTKDLENTTKTYTAKENVNTVLASEVTTSNLDTYVTTGSFTNNVRPEADFAATDLSLQGNDSTGTLTIKYRLNLTRDNIVVGTSESKTVQLTGFKTREVDVSQEQTRLDALNVTFNKKEPLDDIYASSLINPSLAETNLTTFEPFFPSTPQTLPAPQVFKNEISDFNARKIKLLAVYFPGWSEDDWKNLFSYLKNHSDQADAWTVAIANKISPLIDSDKNIGWYNTIAFKGTAADASSLATTQGTNTDLSFTRNLTVIGGYFHEDDAANLQEFNGINQNRIIKNNNTFDSSTGEGIKTALLRNFGEFSSQVLSDDQNPAVIKTKPHEQTITNFLQAVNINNLTDAKIEILKLVPNDQAGTLDVYYTLSSANPRTANLKTAVRKATVNNFLDYQEDVNKATVSWVGNAITPTVQPSSVTTSNLTTSALAQPAQNVFLSPATPLISSVNANNAEGKLTINYKVQATVGQTTYTSTTDKTFVLSGYQTQEQKDQQIVDQATATFTKQESVKPTDFASSVNLSNVLNKVVPTYTAVEGMSIQIKGLKPNDVTGELSLEYVFVKNNKTSPTKTGVVNNWYTFQRQVDAEVPLLTLTQQAHTVLGSEVTVPTLSSPQSNYQTYIYAKMSDPHLILVDLKVLSTNDETGQLNLTYHVARVDNAITYKGVNTLSSNLIGFKTNQELVNSQQINVTGKEQRNTVLASEVNLTNYKNYLQETVPAGFTLVDLKFEPNDETQTLVFKYKVKQNSGTTLSLEKSSTITGFKTIQTALDESSATFTNTLLASNTLPSEVNADNWKQYLTVSNLKPNVTVTDVSITEPNDQNGTFKLLYKLALNNHKSAAAKEYSASSFANYQNKVDGLSVQFVGLDALLNVLPSTVTAQNYSTYLLANPTLPTGYELTDLAFTPDDQLGELIVGYKVLKTGTQIKSATVKSATSIANFLNNNKDAQEKLNRAQAAFSKKAGIDVKTKASAITVPNFDTNVTTNVAAEYTKTIDSVSANDATGVLTINYYLFLGSVKSGLKTATVSGWYSDQDELNATTVSFTNKETAAVTLPSQVTSFTKSNNTEIPGNYAQFLNVENLSPDHQVVEVAVVPSSVNDGAGTFELTYKIAYKNLLSQQKTVSISNFQTTQQKTVQQLNDALNQTTVKPSVTGLEKYPSTLTAANRDDFIFTVPTGYELAEITGLENAKDQEGSVSVKFKVQKQQTTTKSAERNIKVSGFYTFEKDVQNINATWTGLDSRSGVLANLATQENLSTYASGPVYANNKINSSKLSVKINSIDHQVSEGKIIINYKVVLTDDSSDPASKYESSLKNQEITGFKTLASAISEEQTRLNNLEIDITKKNPNFDVYPTSLSPVENTSEPTFPNTVENLPVPTLSLKPNQQWTDTNNGPADVYLDFPNWSEEDWKRLFSYLKSIQSTKPALFNAWLNKIGEQVNSALTAKLANGSTNVEWGIRLWTLRFGTSAADETLFVVGGFGPSSPAYNGIRADQVMKDNWKIESQQSFKNGIIYNMGKYADQYYTNVLGNISPADQARIKNAFNFNGLNPDQEKIEILTVNLDNKTGNVSFDYVIKSTKDQLTSATSTKKNKVVNNFLSYQKDVDQAEAKYTNKADNQNVEASSVTVENLNTYINDPTIIKMVNPSGTVALVPQQDTPLTAQNPTGSLILKYKISLTVENKTYTSEPKQTAVGGFKLQSTVYQETVQAATVAFAKAAGVDPKTLASDINLSNYGSKITGTPSDNSTTYTVTNLVADDLTGVLTISYKVAKNNQVSEIKTATVNEWATTADYLNGLNIAFKVKPAAKNILGSSVVWPNSVSNGDWQTYLSPIGLPEGVQLTGLAAVNVNDENGTFDITYNLEKQVNTTLVTTANSAATKKASVIGFKTILQEVDAINVTFTGKPARNTVLASGVNLTNWENYIEKTVPANYVLVNLAFSSDDTTGNLNISYQVQKQSGSPTKSVLKTASVDGFLATNAAKAAELTRLNTIVDTARVASKIKPAFNVYPSTITKENTQLDNIFKEVQFQPRFATNQDYKVVITTVSANDVAGSLTVSYKLVSTKPNLSDVESKVVTSNAVNNFLSFQKDVDNSTTFWRPKAAAQNVLASEVKTGEASNTNTYVENVETTNLVNRSGLEVRITNLEPNNESGLLTLKYKNVITINNTAYESVEKSTTLSGFKTASEAANEFLKTASATFAKKATTPATDLAKSVTLNNFNDKIETTKPEHTTVSIISLSADDNSGILTITYKLTKDKVVSDNKTATVDNWYSNQQTINSQVTAVSFENKAIAATTLPSQLISSSKTADNKVYIEGNYAEFLDVKNVPNNHWLTDVMIENKDDAAGTFTIKYKLTNGFVTSSEASKNITGFLTTQQKAANDLTKALADTTVVASETGKTKFASSLEPNNKADFKFSVPDGYELGSITGLENKNDVTGSLTVKFKIQKTGTTILSAEKTQENVAGFLTNQQDVGNTVATWTIKPGSNNQKASVVTLEVLKANTHTTGPVLTKNVTPGANLVITPIKVQPTDTTGVLTITYTVTKTVGDTTYTSQQKITEVSGFLTDSNALEQETTRLNELANANSITFAKKNPAHDVYPTSLNANANNLSVLAGEPFIDQSSANRILNALTISNLNNAEAEVKITQANLNDITGVISFKYRLVSTKTGYSSAMSEIKDATVSNFLNYQTDVNQATATFRAKPLVGRSQASKAATQTTAGDNYYSNQYIDLVSINNLVNQTNKQVIFETTDLTGNDDTGTLSFKYKVSITVNDQTYTSANSSNGTINGFITNQKLDQETVDNNQVYFAIKPATNPKTYPSQVTKENFENLIENFKPDNTTYEIKNLIADDKTGNLTVEYVLKKGTAVSLTKTTTIPGWYNKQKAVDEVQVTFAPITAQNVDEKHPKPSKEISPGEINNLDKLKAATLISLNPTEGYEMTDLFLAQNAANNENGTLKISYVIRSKEDSTIASARNQTLDFFKNKEIDEINEALINVNITINLGNTKLPTQWLAKWTADHKDNIFSVNGITDPANYEINEFYELLNPNNDQGTIQVKFDIKKKDGSIVSPKRTAVIKNLYNNQKDVDNTKPVLKIKSEEIEKALKSMFVSSLTKDKIKDNFDLVLSNNKNDANSFSIDESSINIDPNIDEASAVVKYKLKLQIGEKEFISSKEYETKLTGFFNFDSTLNLPKVESKVFPAEWDIKPEEFVFDGSQLVYDIGQASFNKKAASEYVPQDFIDKNLLSNETLINKVLLDAYNIDSKNVKDYVEIIKAIDKDGLLKLDLKLKQNSAIGLGNKTVRINIINIFNFNSEFKENSIFNNNILSNYTNDQLESWKQDDLKTLTQLLSSLSFGIFDKNNITPPDPDLVSKNKQTIKVLNDFSDKSGAKMVDNKLETENFIYDFNKIEIKNEYIIFKPGSIKAKKYYVYGKMMNQPSNPKTLNQTWIFKLKSNPKTIPWAIILGTTIPTIFLLLVAIILFALLKRMRSDKVALTMLKQKPKKK